MEIDFGLPHSYEIEELIELPGTGRFSVPVLYFPRPKSRPEHHGLWLRIRPARGQTWIGVFAFGYGEPPAVSRIVSLPDPDRACIISRGATYIVNPNDPDSWEQIPMMPVLDVRLIPEHQFLVFADFTRLAAYGADGIVWRSPRVCWDDLKILSVTRDSIEGAGYDPMNPW